MLQPKDKDWLNVYKNKTPIYAVYKRHISKQGTLTDWKRRAGKKDISRKWRQKKAGIAILISYKIDFEIKAEKREKGHFIMIKDQPKKKIHNYKNICPQIGAPQYIRQMMTAIKAEINSNTILVRDFNTPLIPVDNSSRQKINKETQVLNDTLDLYGLNWYL